MVWARGRGHSDDIGGARKAEGQPGGEGEQVSALRRGEALGTDHLAGLFDLSGGVEHAHVLLDDQRVDAPGERQLPRHVYVLADGDDGHVGPDLRHAQRGGALGGERHDRLRPRNISHLVYIMY